jgi:tetratricopeptide (TPR) repeat protein
MKELDKAQADLDEALRLDPYFAAAHLGRAGVHLARKEYQPALRDLDEAMRLTPGYTAAMAMRAEVWAACGNPRRALADLDEAVTIDPKFGPAYRQKAWLLAACPDETIRDGKRAVEAAQKAIDHTRDAGGETYEAMAAAKAEAGDFTAAVEWQKKALADAGYVKEKGDAVRKRLESLVANKPVRD